MRHFFYALLILLMPMAMVMGQPTQAYIPGIPEYCYPSATTQVTSFAQLIGQADTSLSPTQTLVLSGLTTQAAWYETPDGYALAPHNDYFNYGPFEDLALLSGAFYQAAYRKGGSIPNVLEDLAQFVTEFNSDQEAYNFIRTLIGSYNMPVQAYVDLYFIHDSLAEYYVLYQESVKEHAGHFIAVHGYDEEYVYVTDYCPIEDPNETPLIGVPVHWDYFLEAWYEASHLSEDAMGPYYMAYLHQNPLTIDTSWLLKRLHEDAFEAPLAIRQCADTLADGGYVPDDVIGAEVAGQFSDFRAAAAEFFGNLDPNEVPDAYTIADFYAESSLLWQDFSDALTVEEKVTALYDIAEYEQRALNTINSQIVDENAITLVSPANNAVLNQWYYTTFQWQDLNEPKKRLQLQIAVNGDFDDKRDLFTINIKEGEETVGIDYKDWAWILKRDDGEQQLSWRVISRNDNTYYSKINVLKWADLEITALSPADGYSFTRYGQAFTISFSAPLQLKTPKVEISTTGNFLDNRSVIKLPYRRRYGYFYANRRILQKLKNKDYDNDGIVYWRVIDKKQDVSTVKPSEIRSFYLPQ